jgi:hypothetical protein
MFLHSISTRNISAALDTTLFDKVCLRFFAGALVSSTNTTDRHDIDEILLKVA